MPSRTPAALGDQLRQLLSTTRRAYRVVREEGGRGIAERLEYRRNRRKAAESYRLWVERYDTLSAEDRDAIRARIEGLPYKPLISIVMPVYDVEEVWLRHAVGSVAAQLYPNWELCIADDHSPRPHVRAVLDELAGQDGRIKVVFRQENGHISAASNSALELANGEFVALLDHDDELTEHALYLVAEELNAHPEADLVYSDEDKLSERGERFFPHFKPDWNPDLLRSINYVSHLMVCRTTVLNAVGGFPLGHEGAQDYDLVLRLVDQVPESHIRHIPHILYHWRSIAGSMARGTDEKGYVYEAGRGALAAHFQRQRLAVPMAEAPGCAYRPMYPLSERPRVSVVLHARDSDHANRASELLRGADYPDVEILMLVRHGRFEGAEVDTGDSRIRSVQLPAGLGPSAQLNYAARVASGEVLAFLGGTEPRSGWLSEMVSHVIRPEIGAVGAKLYGPEGTIHQGGGLILGIRGLVGHAYHGVSPQIQAFGRMIERLEMIQNYSALSRDCLVMRRQVFEAVDGFDDATFPSEYYDVDLCLRLGQRGYRLLWTPFAELSCVELSNTGTHGPQVDSHELLRQQASLRERWAHILARDPAYNPNLTLDREDFSLACPPCAPKPWRETTALSPDTVHAPSSQRRSIG